MVERASLDEEPPMDAVEAEMRRRDGDEEGTTSGWGSSTEVPVRSAVDSSLNEE